MIGIVLLVLLCILLLLVCCVLFVPIRYQAYIKKNETLQAKVKVSYLLRIFTVFFGYDDGKQSGKVKILGITIRDFFPTEEKKKRLEEKEKKKEEKRRKKNASKQKNSKDVKEVNQTTKNQQLQTAKQQTTKDKQITKDKQTTSINTSNHSVKLTVSVDVVKEETSREANKENIKESPQQVKTEEQANSQADKQHEISKEQQEEKKPTIFERIKEHKDKDVTFCKKIIDKVKNIKYTICNLWDKLQYLKETILFYYEILTREESKRAIEKLKTQSGRLFKHIKPRKVKGIIELGFDAPATTGDIFGKVCMLYPIYGNNIVIIPRFEEEIMKGELVIKGRIQIAVLLHIAWKIIFDKEIRTLYEALTGGSKNEQ